jgi:hypothetical protein
MLTMLLKVVTMFVTIRFVTIKARLTFRKVP